MKGESAPTDGFRWGEMRMREMSENAGLPANTGGLQTETKRRGEKDKKRSNEFFTA